MKKQTYTSVWDALEDTPEAAASMRVRAELMIAVQRYVEASGKPRPGPRNTWDSLSHASTICCAGALRNSAWIRS